jgi:hypothetical protein
MPLHYHPVLSPLRVAPPPQGYERPAGLPRYTVKTIVALLPRLPRLLCVTCRGQLHVEWPTDFAGRVYCLSCAREYAEIVDRMPTPLSMHLKEDQRRGRPPKSLTEQDLAVCMDCKLRRPKYQRRRCQPCTGMRASRHRNHLCPDCQTQMVIGHQNARCSSCASASRWAASLTGRLLVLLADRHAHHRSDLYEALGVSAPQLRQAIRRARAHGWTIKLRLGTYRLEGAAS